MPAVRPFLLSVVVLVLAAPGAPAATWEGQITVRDSARPVAPKRVFESLLGGYSFVGRFDVAESGEVIDVNGEQSRDLTGGGPAMLSWALDWELCDQPDTNQCGGAGRDDARLTLSSEEDVQGRLGFVERPRRNGQGDPFVLRTSATHDYDPGSSGPPAGAGDAFLLEFFNLEGDNDFAGLVSHVKATIKRYTPCGDKGYGLTERTKYVSGRHLFSVIRDSNRECRRGADQEDGKAGDLSLWPATSWVPAFQDVKPVRFGDCGQPAYPGTDLAYAVCGWVSKGHGPPVIKGSSTWTGRTACPLAPLALFRGRYGPDQHWGRYCDWTSAWGTLRWKRTVTVSWDLELVP